MSPDRLSSRPVRHDGGAAWRPLLVLLLLQLLLGCSQAAGGPEDGGFAEITPVAWPTLFPTPTLAAPPVAAEPVEPAGGEPAQSPAADPHATPGEPAWSFLVTGDTWKDTPVLRRILSDAQEHGDEFIVICGDITPQGRPEQFAQFAQVVSTVPVPVYVAPGNHDVASSGTTDYFEQYFPRHQAFEHRNLFVAIADDSSHSFSADELQWLDAQLAATNQPLKMVFMHVPPLMPYPVPDEKTMQQGAAELMALLEKHDVDAVFGAHLQAYSRMERGGITYTITGGGGSPPHVPAFLGGRYHYVRVTIQGNTATQRVVWLDDVATPTP